MTAPTIERNQNGDLTAESLRNGAREQYAVIRQRGRITIELAYAAEGTLNWRVTLDVASRGGEHSSLEQGFASLDEARVQFHRLVRRNP